jgi:anti-sigma factor RsiW
MRCDEFSAQLDAYLAEELDGHRREDLRDHLRSCGDCRRTAVRRDASLMFVATSPKDSNPDRVAEVTQAVLGQIRQQRLERRLGRRRQPWLAAAAAAVLSLAVVIGWRIITPNEIAQVPARSDVQVADSPSPPPRVEVDMAGEGVRVYQYADQQDGDTAVTFIINPELEL